jgi:hypothetical protein
MHIKKLWGMPQRLEQGIDEVRLEKGINRVCKGDLYVIDAWLARARHKAG